MLKQVFCSSVFPCFLLIYICFSAPLAAAESLLPAPVLAIDFDHETRQYYLDQSGSQLDVRKNKTQTVRDAVSGQACRFAHRRACLEQQADWAINGYVWQRTVALWFRAEDEASADPQILWEEGDKNAGLNVYIQAGRLFAGTYQDDTGDWTSVELRADGQWHHVAVVLDVPLFGDAADGLTLSLDGQIVAQTQAAFLPMHGGDGNGIGGAYKETVIADPSAREGRRTIKKGAAFVGLIDEFQVFDQALDEAALITLILRAGLAHYYPFAGVDPLADALDSGVDLRTAALPATAPLPIAQETDDAALDFSTDTDALGFHGAPAIALEGGFALSAWVLPAAVQDSSTDVNNIVSLGYRYDADPTRAGEVVLRQWRNQLDCSTSNPATGGYSSVTGGLLRTGHGLQHVLVDVSADGRYALYLDGALIGTAQSPVLADILANAAAGHLFWGLGGRNPANGGAPDANPAKAPDNTRSFDGLIDEVRIYNHALHALQRRLLFTRRPANCAPLIRCPARLTSGSIAYLPAAIIDDQQATTAEWSVISAPPGVALETVLIHDSGSAQTFVMLPAPGTYQLRLRADDGHFISEQTVSLHSEAGSASNLAINFQPWNVAVPAGYVADTGLVLAERGSGLRYGWTTSNNSTRQRAVPGVAPELTTLIHLGHYNDASWEIALPNGTYRVALDCGDPLYPESQALYIESLAIIDLDGPDTHDHIDARVTVRDGHLSISPAPVGTAKLNAVSITLASPGADALLLFDGAAPVRTWQVNFQPPGMPIPAGFLADDGAVFAARDGDLAYGWSAANATTRLRNVAGVAPELDSLIHLGHYNDARWEIAMPNGAYEVVIDCGDPLYPEHNHLCIEDLVIPDLDGPDAHDAITVQVNIQDGRLSLTASSLGTAKLNALLIRELPMAVTDAIQAHDDIDPRQHIWRINFQPGNEAVPVGYLMDFGAPFSDPRNGFAPQYGWQAFNHGARNRGTGPDQVSETIIHLLYPEPRSWRMVLPDGWYRVRVACGDPLWETVNDLLLDGLLLRDPGSGPAREIIHESLIEVDDTDLHLTTPGSDTRVRWIEIAPETGPGANG